MATKVNIGTKKADELIRDMNYRHPKGTTPYEVYGRMSDKKRDSWQQICSDCTYLHGENLHIVGASCYFYSCVYAYPIYNDDYDAVESMVIRKETKGNTYELTLPIDDYMQLVERRAVRLSGIK